MDHKVRWGILGTASIARRRFLPAIMKSEISTAAAIGSRDIIKAQVFAQEFDIPRPYGSYQDVLDDLDVDAVYIPLPNEMHAEWTIKAADAGKHVLCEKPMAVDGDEALRMADYCRDKGVLLMEGFMYRFNPRTRKIKEVLDSGMIGEIRAVIIQFGFTIRADDTTRQNATKGAGSLMDTGCYCINASRYVFGEEPVAALASQRKHQRLGYDITTSAILEFKDGRTSLVSASFESAYRSELQVAGSEGILRVNNFFSPPTEGTLTFTVETKDNKVHSFESDAVDQFLIETDHFANCVRASKPVLLNSHTEAVPNARVIDAIRASAESGCRVAVAKD